VRGRALLTFVDGVADAGQSGENVTKAGTDFAESLSVIGKDCILKYSSK
jgi:hypothetical protein